MTITQEILAEIKAYDRIIVHRHQRPDPDALGSQAGLVEMIKASFPDKQVFKAGGPIDDLGYMTEMDEVADESYVGALVIVTDTANAPRISDDRYHLGDKLIKVDHHPNDEPYGDLSWVNTKASSCSEMIADFYQEFKSELTLTDEGARLLYGGIVGDTGRFMYPATTSHTFEVVAMLTRFNFDAPRLNRYLNDTTLNVAKLSGYVLQQMELDEDGAGMVLLPYSILEEYGVTDAETAALIPLPGQVDSVIAWGIFVEQPEGYYRVRLRSKGPAINQLAKEHNGGGHPLASGANARDLAEVADMYKEIQKIVKNSKV